VTDEAQPANDGAPTVEAARHAATGEVQLAIVRMENETANEVVVTTRHVRAKSKKSPGQPPSRGKMMRTKLPPQLPNPKVNPSAWKSY